MALRWRKQPAPKGQASIAGGPLGSSLFDGDVKFATVSPLRSPGSARYTGWFWVAGWSSGVPHKNTCDDPPLDEQTAKAQAMAYVREQLQLKTMKDGI